MRVLMVDDHTDTRLSTARLLKVLGMEVDTASGVREAMILLRSGPYDALITDMDMQDGSGVTLIRAMQNEGIRVPHVIMASARTLTDYPEYVALKDEGVVHSFYIKGHDAPDVLISALENGPGIQAASGHTIRKRNEMQL
jgi:DNA-binding NtrC family response regulator